MRVWVDDVQSSLDASRADADADPDPDPDPDQQSAVAKEAVTASVGSPWPRELESCCMYTLAVVGSEDAALRTTSSRAMASCRTPREALPAHSAVGATRMNTRLADAGG